MNIPALEAVNLSKSFALLKEIAGAGHKKILQAVDSVSINIMQGETVGIAGESGCGKSTLAKMMAGLIHPDSGTVRFHGCELDSMPSVDRKIFRKSVQMIFQDPFSSLNPRMRIGDAIAEPIEIHNMAKASECRNMAIILMEQTGLSADLYDRFPHEFSGGQRQRIGIARALAASPAILVADEPVSSLDISIQAQIINLLQELRQKHGLTMMMISHDLSVLRQMCDRIAVMYLGAIVEIAPATSIFSNCRHPYTEALLAAIPSTKTSAKKSLSGMLNETNLTQGIPKGCRFHPRCPHARDICRTTPPPAAKTDNNHITLCHFSGELYGN